MDKYFSVDFFGKSQNRQRETTEEIKTTPIVVAVTI